MKNTGALSVATPTDREISMTRVFDAPRSLVFEALTRSELLKRWFAGPPGWSLAVCEIDLKVGGGYRYVWRGPKGNEMGMSGVYRDVVPPERIVQTESFDEPWYPGEALGRLVLVEQGGKTTLTLTVLYESREARDAVLKTPMAQGVAAGYDRLAELLASPDRGLPIVLTRDELIKALQHEVHVLLHLASKVDPAVLDYRPTPKQRSVLELLQYMAIMGPIHMRAIKAGDLDMDAWRNTWRTEEAAAKAMNLEQAKDAIGRQSALFTESLNSCSDADLRAEIEMFGSKASRGSWIVNLVLCHYVAYRMQLFLYLKACGREELNTMNLWLGRDAV